MSPDENNALVGKCFVIFGEDGQWNYQGEVIGRPEPGIYLVQFFDVIMGRESTMSLFPITEMIARGRKNGAFIFFENDEHMREWQATWGQRKKPESSP